ncbi:rhomboid family intramembrane serine protease [Leadbetterella sp. DM7]|uniref:rhomboid family intramembrane serine protease n=1 Tax=Leadbetterella sp. DM7 TaxID=3235085 RepID=UPI00349EC4C1
MNLTTVIILITVIMSIYGFNNYSFLHRLIDNPYTVNRRKEYYRLLTSGFIHADYLHLLLNMYVLYMFGSNMESVFAASFGQQGGLYFMGLYILGILVANIPDQVRHRNNPGYNSLGASGGVSAVVFAFIILVPLSKLMIFPIPVQIPAWIFAIIYVAYSVYMDRRQADRVNHLAHLWGALWGVVFIVWTYPGALPYFFQQIAGSLRF